MRNLLTALLISVVLGQTAPLHAEDANPYGARGRSILSAGAYAYRAQAPEHDPFDHRLSWAVGLHFTMLHFVVRNLAVGGTVLGSLGNDPAPEGPTRERTMGADIDVVWHVPLTGKLSLRLWGYGGIRRYRTTTPLILDEPTLNLDGTIDFHAEAMELRRVSAVAGIAPELLVHLSPSVALGLGPSLTFTIPVSAHGVRDRDVRLVSSISYSFGPSRQGEARFEHAARFSERGRTAVVASLSVGDRWFTSVGAIRFVRSRVGIGVYVSGGASRFLEQQGNLRSAGGGVQALFDVPLVGSTSLLVLPQTGYLWQGYKAHGPDGAVQAREFQFTLPAYFTLHLHEAVVVGLGPELSAHKRFVDKGPEPDDDPYLRAGLSSVLLGSF